MPYAIVGSKYRLTCRYCRSHIDTPIARGENNMTQAFERLRAQARRDGWTLGVVDRCPNHP
jgi:hypothetical protein